MVGDVLLGIAAWLEASGVGTVAGFVASLIGIFGVPAAIWRAFRAQRAAEIAAAAVKQAERRLVTFRITTTLATVMQELADLKTLHRLRLRNVLLLSERYDRLRRALVDITERHPDLTTEQKAELQDLVVLLRELELAGSSGDDPTDDVIGVVNHRLSESMDRLAVLLLGLERRSVEDGNVTG